MSGYHFVLVTPLLSALGTRSQVGSPGPLGMILGALDTALGRTFVGLGLCGAGLWLSGGGLGVLLVPLGAVRGPCLPLS